MGVRHEYVRRMRAMDAAYLRERAAICLRLANGLSWNNPARSQLLDLAQDFDRRARNSETGPPASARDDQN
jgi:hypothetical protein